MLGLKRYYFFLVFANIFIKKALIEGEKTHPHLSAGMCPTT